MISLPTLEKGIFDTAFLIDSSIKNNHCDTIPTLIGSLNKLISTYSKQTKGLVLKYFAYRFQSIGMQMNIEKQTTKLQSLVSQVKKCFSCVSIARRFSEEPFEPIALFSKSGQADFTVIQSIKDQDVIQKRVNFETALKTENREELLFFSKTPTILSIHQATTLLRWAAQNWDPEMLFFLLSKLPIDQRNLEVVVQDAFEKGKFADVADVIISHHLPALSQESREKVENWIKETISYQEEPAMDTETFLKKIEEMLNHNEMFDGLMNVDLLGELSIDEINALLAWAEFHKIEELKSFLKNHGFVE